jgi:competence ComEA-like helix-hairpin-helix protein
MILTLALVMAAIPASFSLAAEMEKIDINSATKEQLMTLAGVGEKVAESIIQYREEKGPFGQPEDVIQVKGFGPMTWEKNKDRIVANPPTKKNKSWFHKRWSSENWFGSGSRLRAKSLSAHDLISRMLAFKPKTERDFALSFICGRLFAQLAKLKRVVSLRFFW